MLKNKFTKKIKENVEYLGVDEDPTALEYLKNHGLAGTNTEGYRQGQNYDFAFGLEVIEHIRQEKSIDFLSDIRNKTNKAFFLTTPNFEGWDGKGYSQVSQRPEYARMRYMPDHLRSFQATSENPHHHKQIMTAKGLQSQLEEALCPDNWSWCVIKAWPWLLTDLGSGKCYMHFFKLHAVAWRRAQFKNDMRLCLQEICENNPVFAAADDQEARNGN